MAPKETAPDTAGNGTDRTANSVAYQSTTHTAPNCSDSTVAAAAPGATVIVMTIMASECDIGPEGRSGKKRGGKRDLGKIGFHVFSPLAVKPLRFYPLIGSPWIADLRD